MDPVDQTEDPRTANARTRAQVAVMREAFGDRLRAADVDGRGPAKDDAEIGFLYRADHLLVRADAAQDVLDHVEKQGLFDGAATIVRDEAPVRDRLVVLRLPRRNDEREPVLATLEELDERFGKGVATPDHVVFVTGPIGKYCPADEPRTPAKPAPWPPPEAGTVGRNPVRVGVVDTGLWMPAVGSAENPWLTSATVTADSTDEEQVDAHAIHPYAGHGTFVAGVVRCMAPGAVVEVEGALTHGGAVLESAIVAQLDEALNDNDDPQVINISAGTYTRNDFALLGFEMLAEAHGFGEGSPTLVVAAAGNDSTQRPFWPAAFPWVVAVGAVDADGKVASYSNHGSWVDVYARGTDLVNAFPRGLYTCYEPPNVGEVRRFEGLAEWSGTSFSAPIVTGLIAAETGDGSANSTQAWVRVRNAGTHSTDPWGRSITIVGPLT